MMNHLPFYAYKGKEPYIFISYSHRDSEKVFSIIRKFNENGYRIWYDEGIDPGNEWPDEIAAALCNCALFVVFISPRSIASENVRNEINFALTKKLPVVAIFLEETELTPGMQLQIGSKQAIMKYNMTDDSFFYKCETSFERIGLTREEPVPIKAEPVKTEPVKTEPVISEPIKPEINFEIPENALRFEPKGTAVITLKDKTQYTVSANAMMFCSNHAAINGMQNGFVYKDNARYTCLPFSEIKEYKKQVAYDWDDEEYQILKLYSPLYVIEASKKREPLLIDFYKYESIVFDMSHTFNSVAEYALIERIDDVPLVVPTASILLEESNIENGGLKIKYHLEMPFKNEAAIQIKRILGMEVTNVALASDRPRDNRRHIEITVTKRNNETISDELFGWFSLIALTRKGLMRLGFDKIKRITFM
ncbi:MAG: toll/interleukin-1 receptor domain-containing protein [Ruminococcus sp.]|jgi:hypothetical protein|nr:toll/interleukin-1 receptor domain-containing protein [Ruminococcus sp.]